MKKSFIVLIILMAFVGHAFAYYHILCPSKNVDAQNGTIGNVAYFDNMFNATDCNVTQVADPTPDQIANQIAQEQVEANLPQNKFNVNLFIQQLAQTNLMTDPAVYPYYAIVKDLCAFKNFQGLANLIAGLLKAGIFKQTEVDILDNTLEQQQINLAAYNAQVDIAY